MANFSDSDLILFLHFKQRRINFIPAQSLLFTPYYLYEIDTNGFLHEVNNEMCIKWYSDNKIDIQFQKWEV